MTELLTTLNSMSPLGVIALLGLVIYLLVKNQKAVRGVSDNHLSGLPDMQSDIKLMKEAMLELVILTKGQNDKLTTINDNCVWIKARVNGKGSV